MSIIMKFEYLPNEILMRCFQYLNAADVIHSFDQLNCRFSQLIRNTLLHLSCSQFQQCLLNIYEQMFIQSLTIVNCKFEEIFQLFKSFSMIKYFKVQHLYNNVMNIDELDVLDINVETFIIYDSHIKYFEVVEFLLTQMSNLRSFAISSSEAEMINAFRWENLIKNSLHHLHTFKFCFNYIDNDALKINEKLSKCQAFETIFWHQHNWFINYEVDEFTLLIFTTPYIRKKYELFPLTNKFIYNFNDENLFNNVTHLTVYENARKTEFHYFPNVLSLTLKSSYHHLSSKHKLIKTLNEIMNTSNVKHLTFHGARSSLEEIIKQLLNVNSLTIEKFILLSLLDNCKVYELLKTKIIKLDISISHCNEENTFSSLSGIPSPRCGRAEFNIKKLDELLFILQRYPNLLMINLGYVGNEIYSWIQLNASSLAIHVDFKLLNDKNRLTRPKSSELDLIVDLIY